MFACHTIQNSRNSTGTSAHPSYASRAQDSYAPHHSQHSYDISPSSYTLPPVNAASPPYSHFVGSLPSYSSPTWSGQPDSSPFLSYNRWPQNSSPTHTLSSLPTSCTLRETPYGSQSSNRPSESPNYGDTRGHGYQPTPSPDMDYVDRERHRPDNIGLSISSPDVVPPPRNRVSPGSAREPVSGRGSNRPVGILRCTSCRVTSSPEWRKGPTGKKELCNACVIFLIFCATHPHMCCGLVAVSAMLGLVRKRTGTWRQIHVEGRKSRVRLQSRKRATLVNPRRLLLLVREPGVIRLRVLHSLRRPRLVQRLEARCTLSIALSPLSPRPHHHQAR